MPRICRLGLDELASMYHLGKEKFFDDWQEFVESEHLEIVNPSPRLALIARDFHGRTDDALAFLEDHDVPLVRIPVTVYEDITGRWFIDVETGLEPTLPAPSDEVDHTKIAGRRVRITDLVEAGLLAPGAQLVWQRPRLGVTYKAEITENGAIKLENGATYATPSKAGMEAAGMVALDGWYAWRVGSSDGATLDSLRNQLAEQAATTETATESD